MCLKNLSYDKRNIGLIRDKFLAKLRFKNSLRRIEIICQKSEERDLQLLRILNKYKRILNEILRKISCDLHKFFVNRIHVISFRKDGEKTGERQKRTRKFRGEVSDPI